ncbi:hypothetical protein HYQ46_010696 [Verticillium longisporum]|nr:hypothetical protein HYQ46_010696 [Verticillium longisporum]
MERFCIGTTASPRSASSELPYAISSSCMRPTRCWLKTSHWPSSVLRAAWSISESAAASVGSSDMRPPVALYS